MDAYSMGFDGALLRRGFWLYVWRVTQGARVVLYVGRTGDSSSPHASSPFNRVGQHLDARPKAKANAICSSPIATPRRGTRSRSFVLAQQAANNTKEQFSNSPDLMTALRNAVMDSLDAHTSMGTQALNSETVLAGLLDVLLNHAELWESLRERAAG